MRRARRRIGGAFVALVLATTAAGCTGPGETGTSPAPDAPSTSGAADAPWDPGDIPDASTAVVFPPAQRGDCPVDPAEPGTITLVVTSDDDATPVEVTYPAFREDGTQLVRRMTQPGPVITVVQSDCTGGAGGGPWSFVATAERGSLACALFFGGRLVASDSAFAEGGADEHVSADCTGHPGM
jgi:hypothetical protein